LEFARQHPQRAAAGAATADAKSGLTPIWASMVLDMA
jgi:hypothetical protein